ncbi:uncharacterized protein LOC127279866 [Leptopilina boulardi]|uniref:uncharacterized protein LOC127279866 n=1 Tax=Leptopilina boulardi TaxID=63433 RepID=UPI0021F505C6|nr:uncharacterized protein LOC127279866 [Leptopilina boulardi]
MNTVHALLKTNIPLEKLDHPAFREWLNENVKGGGNIVSAKWQREKYLLQVKIKCDHEITKLLKEKQIVILCDETTNRKCEAVFQILFRILLSGTHVEPLNVVAAVNVLQICTDDSCSKPIIQALNKYDVNFENVIAISTDSAPYMNLCVRLLKELLNTSFEHIQY